MWSDAVPIQLCPSPVSHEVAACRSSFRLLGLAALQFRTFLFGRAAKRGSPVLRTGLSSRPPRTTTTTTTTTITVTTSATDGCDSSAFLVRFSLVFRWAVCQRASHQLFFSVRQVPVFILT